MSSHHEWVEEVVAQHDAQRPFAPENGQPLLFKRGDPVIYTNPQGVEFRLRVTGLYTRTDTPCASYARGARYLLDWDCPWVPVPEARMRPDPQGGAEIAITQEQFDSIEAAWHRNLANGRAARGGRGAWARAFARCAQEVLGFEVPDNFKLVVR